MNGISLPAIAMLLKAANDINDERNKNTGNDKPDPIKNPPPGFTVMKIKGK